MRDIYLSKSQQEILSPPANSIKPNPLSSPPSTRNLLPPSSSPIPRDPPEQKEEEEGEEGEEGEEEEEEVLASILVVDDSLLSLKLARRALKVWKIFLIPSSITE